MIDLALNNSTGQYVLSRVSFFLFMVFISSQCSKRKVKAFIVLEGLNQAGNFAFSAALRNIA